MEVRVTPVRQSRARTRDARRGRLHKYCGCCAQSLSDLSASIARSVTSVTLPSAEIVTTKGRALAFDDAGCAAEALAARELGLDEVSSVWVIDFTHPDSLISAGSATFVHSKEFKTPMGSGVIATADPAIADSLARAVGGEILNWTQVLTLAERDFLGAH